MAIIIYDSTNRTISDNLITTSCALGRVAAKIFADSYIVRDYWPEGAASMNDDDFTALADNVLLETYPVGEFVTDAGGKTIFVWRADNMDERDWKTLRRFYANLITK